MKRKASLLVLGPDRGWHADELRCSAARHQIAVVWARYESLAAAFDSHGQTTIRCQILAPVEEGGSHDFPGRLRDYDHILARTMPAGSLEHISMRLSALHCHVDQGFDVVNPPSTLELAIDKFRTLARVAALGYPVPETIVVQTRREALEAFDTLGGDVVVKPIFGGEGRGVMRLQDRELAWTTFGTLESLQAVIYVQRFVPPGGVDTRLLIVGRNVFGFRRRASSGWKTNVAQGGSCERIELDQHLTMLASRVATDFCLLVGAIDLIDDREGIPQVLEINAVPGWRGAQSVMESSIADHILECLLDREKSGLHHA